MYKNIAFRILSGFLLLAIIAGISSFAFFAGMTRGAALNLPAAAAGGQIVPNFAYHMPFFPMFPFFGFGLIKVFLLLFLLILAFGAARRMMMGPRWGWHNHMQHGQCDARTPGSPEFVPPMFAEMHRRAHESMASEKKED